MRRALDESSFYAARGLRPPARLIQGSPDHVWDVTARLLLAEAKTEYLGLEDPSQVAKAGVQERLAVRAMRTISTLVDRNVQTRHVLTRAWEQATKANFPTVDPSNLGETRVADRLPAKTCVVDRRFALVPLNLKLLTQGMMIVTDPAVVSILVGMHRTLWRSAHDPRAVADEPPAELGGVLAMLGSGLPDDCAAQRLNMSPRTYSRRVRELLGLLGASSRFEGGLEAARRGWL